MQTRTIWINGRPTTIYGDKDIVVVRENRTVVRHEPSEDEGIIAGILLGTWALLLVLLIAIGIASKADD